MPHHARQTSGFRPATIAIHDQGHVLREPTRVEVRRQKRTIGRVSAGGRWAAQDSDLDGVLPTVRRAGGIDSAVLNSSLSSSWRRELVIGRSNLPWLASESVPVSSDTTMQMQRSKRSVMP